MSRKIYEARLQALRPKFKVPLELLYIPYHVIRRQQGDAYGGVTFWAGIIDDALSELFRVPEGAKLTSKDCTHFLDKHLALWLNDLSLPRQRQLNFIHDNAPSHTAKATSFLASLGKKNETLMIWPRIIKPD